VCEQFGADGDEAAYDATEHLAVQRLLVIEIVIEECAVDAGRGADLLDGGRGEALPGEELFRGVQDVITGGDVGRHTS
jgi:hypothetical protein